MYIIFFYPWIPIFHVPCLHRFRICVELKLGLALLISTEFMIYQHKKPEGITLFREIQLVVAPVQFAGV